MSKYPLSSAYNSSFKRSYFFPVIYVILYNKSWKQIIECHYWKMKDLKNQDILTKEYIYYI